MRLLPRSAFARTVALIAVLLLINQLVSYVMVGLYVVKPSMQQVSSVVARQVQGILALDQWLEQANLSPEQQQSLVSNYTEATGIHGVSVDEAPQQGLADTTTYNFLSAQLS